MTHHWRGMAILLVLGLLCGCVSQSSRMVRSSADHNAVPPGKALVVFMRPSRYGGAIQSTIYDVKQPQDAYLGIVSGKTKIGYVTEPGQHLFMVIGENADFLDAQLEAGKTYYVLVSPRMGMWKARFSLLPIHNDANAKYNLKSKDFSDWQQDTAWVDKTAEAEQWYAENKGSVEAKKQDYLVKWNARSAADKAELFLHADDGV
jgi:hypothetical protein